MELLKLWAIIVRWKKIFIVVVLTTVLIPVVGSFLIKPVYKCKAKVWVKYKSLVPALVNPGLTSDYGKFSVSTSDYLADTFIKLIESRTVVDPVVKKLDLRDKRGNLFDVSAYVEPGYVKKIFTQKECLEVAQMDDSEVFEIKTYSTDINKAAGAANAIADEFLTVLGSLSNLDVDAARKILETETERVRREWYDAEQQRMQYRMTKLAVNLDVQKTNLVNELSTLDDTKRANETLLAADKATLATIEEDLKKSQQTDAGVAIDPPSASSISNYQSKLYDLEVSLADKLTQYTESHPNVRSVRAEIAYTRNAIKSLLKKTTSREGIVYSAYFDTLVQKYGDAMIEMASVMAKNHALELQTQELARKQRAVIELDHEYTKITERTDVLKSTLTTLLQQLEIVKTANTISPTNANIVERAVVPHGDNVKDYKYFPNKKLIIVIALFLGISMGLSAVLFLDYIDDSLRTGADVEDALKRPVLAIIRYQKSKAPRGDGRA